MMISGGGAKDGEILFVSYLVAVPRILCNWMVG